MQVKVHKVLELLESNAPLALKEDWDNPGFQIGNRDSEIGSILFSLDPSLEAIMAAIRPSGSLLITHHPLIFRPIAMLDLKNPSGIAIKAAIENRVHIYSAHTNLDACPGGLNDLLARRLGLMDTEPILRQAGEWEAGLGRIGNISPTGFEPFLENLLKVFPNVPIRFLRPSKEKVSRIGVVTGSGGSLVEKAFELGCDLLITGDIGHHHYLEAKGLGMGIVDVTHHMSEEIPFRDFALGFIKKLKDNYLDVETSYFLVEAPPFENRRI